MKTVMETRRLVLREIELEDASFLFGLMNEEPWIRYIGDRGIRSLTDARDFITDRLRPSYAREGFGFWLVELGDGGTPIGICGLVNRDALDYVDLGFALCEQFWGEGYAREASEAAIHYAREEVGLDELAAITHPENHRSAGLLEALGFRFEHTVRLPDEEIDLRLYLRAL